MPISLKIAVNKFLLAVNPAQGTRDEYKTTLRKWSEWGNGVSVENLDRKVIRDFLTWVHEQAVEREGTNPGRTANRAREQLRAVLSWAWEHDMIESLARFPKPVPQRDVAGRHYLTRSEMKTLYFAPYQMKRPKGWQDSFHVRRQYFIDSHGGLTDEICYWKDCSSKCLNGIVFCPDHVSNW